MKDIVIIGAGSFGREVAQLIKDINQEEKRWNLLGYIDETPEKQDMIINNNPVLGDFNWIEKNSKCEIWAVCAIGNPKDKFNLVSRSMKYNVHFANLVHPSVIKNEYIDMGYGCIICSNTILSLNLKIGNHVTISPGCGIGHDTVIGDYSTLYWNVTLSGNVVIGEGCELGSKSVIIQKLRVGEWSIVGAGTTAVRDIPAHCTTVGVPARPIKYHNAD